MRRKPINGRRAPLERRKALDTSGGGLRRRALPRTGRPATVGASSRRQRSPELDVPADTVAAVRARSAGRCEAPLAVDCTGLGADVHHRKRRRDGGHAVTNLLHLCRPCHASAHAHPHAARAAGLIVSAYEEPADVPVLVSSRLVAGPRWVQLTADGGYAS